MPNLMFLIPFFSVILTIAVAAFIGRHIGYEEGNKRGRSHMNDLWETTMTRIGFGEYNENTGEFQLKSKRDVAMDLLDDLED